MNDSLQSELEVSAQKRLFEVEVASPLFRIAVSFCTESLSQAGGERTSGWDAASWCFSAQEAAEWKEAKWSEWRFAVVFFLSEISKTRCNPICLKPVCLLAASDEDPPEEKNNLMLHKAIRTLFARAPLFHTQTLNLAAHPVPETCCCCTENNAEGTATAVEHTDAAEDQESLSLLSPCRTKPQKRLRGADLVRERKRRKSCSWSEYCIL